jgi:aspartyl aminopeptidase
MKEKSRGVAKSGPSAFNPGLLAFLAASPTPFHAARELSRRLRDAGFREWKESESWKIVPGERGFVVRNDSSIVAFCIGTGDVAKQGFRVIGAHTDSPCLRLKPQPEQESCGLLKVGVEVYGSALLSTWFDRDLSLAGRVSYLNTSGRVASRLVDFERPIAILPNLAIHLNREVNEHRSINKQVEMPPVLCQWDHETEIRGLLADELARAGEKDVAEIVDFELSFYDTQRPVMAGLREDFIVAARLDNLLSCYIGAMALLEAGPDATAVLVCNDHEEVGSASTSGAEGPFLRAVLERLSGGGEAMLRAIDRSMLISTDNAHAVHPNYPERHDSRHAPLLNGGPALKINNNQRYATNSETAAAFALCCEKADVAFQRFVSRTDMACGSTIGPITASQIGIRTVDVGVPTFAMHSIREVAGARDPYALYRAAVEFYRLPQLFE